MPNSPVAAQRLDPASYRRVPWKNGGGVSVDIAGVFPTESEAASWSGMTWRLGRTRIERPGPFSDLSGLDRILTVIEGRGLRLKPAGAPVIDVREPMRPVRFPGEWAIESELEAGPVGVLNLMGNRARAEVDLAFVAGAGSVSVEADTVVIYAPIGPAEVVLNGEAFALPADGALQVDGMSAVEVAVRSGTVAVATIVMKR
jgi:environmental stress-induced protein Ves